MKGGDGSDVAEFSGKMSITAWIRMAMVTDINTTDGDDGTDTLDGIETVRFRTAN